MVDRWNNGAYPGGAFNNGAYPGGSFNNGVGSSFNNAAYPGGAFNNAAYAAAAAQIALLIANGSDVYNLDRTGQTGAVKMQGFTTWAGYIDLSGNSYTSLDCSAITISNGQIGFRSNALTSIDFTSLVTANELIDLFGNALTSASFPALTSNAAGKHIYLSQNFSLTSASFPALVTANGAIVLSRDYNLTSVDFSSLVTLNHEVELDYTKALPSVSFPALTTINGTVSGPSLTLGGDMTDIGQSRPPALTSVSWPVLANVNNAQINITWCTNLTTIDLSPWNVIADGFRLDMNRCALTQAAINAALIKLNAIKGSVTNGYVDFRFQTGGAAPSGAGLTAKAALVTAWGAGNVLTD